MAQLFILNTYTSKFITGWLAWTGATLGAAIGFIFGSTVLFYIFFATLALDLVTGICAALIRGDKVNSHGLQGTTYKLIAYLSVLLVSAFLGVAFPALYWVTPAAIGWIILGEGVSVLENAEVILGRRIPFLAKLVKILDIIKNGKKP